MFDDPKLNEEILKATIGIVSAALGFAAKCVVDWHRERRARRHNQRDELETLQGLLASSKAVFQSQNYQARRLMKLLVDRLGTVVDPKMGFDEVFCRSYATYTDEERELHQLLRGTTLNSMHQVNTQLMEWIGRNGHFLSRPTNDAVGRLFAKELRQLSLHLRQWTDKLVGIVQNNETRALVYLDDEKKHGTSFPKIIEVTVSQMLGTCKRATIRLENCEQFVVCPLCGKPQLWNVSYYAWMSNIVCDSCGLSVDVYPPPPSDD